MSIASLNYLDLVIVVLVLILSLKGLLGGFLRELTSLVAIVGAVAVASRLAAPLARLIEEKLFRLPNPAAMDLALFVVLLLLVWGLVTLLGRWAERVSGASETPGMASRIGGVVLAGIRYFLIFAIIVSALYRTSLVREKLSGAIKGSQLYPVLVRTGAALVNLPAATISVKPGGSRTSTR